MGRFWGGLPIGPGENEKLGVLAKVSKALTSMSTQKVSFVHTRTPFPSRDDLPTSPTSPSTEATP